MRKILAILLAALMLCCGGNGGDTESGTSVPSSSDTGENSTPRGHHLG